MKRIVSLVLSLVMLFSITSTMDFSAFAADKPLMQQTTPLYDEYGSEEEQMQPGQLYYTYVDDEMAVFEFTPSTSGYYSFNVYNEYKDDFYGLVYNENIDLIGETSYLGTSADEYVQLNLTAGYTYYFAIVALNGYGYVEFSIDKCSSLSNGTITLSKTSYTYNGEEKKPGVTVKVNGVTLKNNLDYKVTYSNNKKAGTAKVKVTGMKKYTGSLTKTFTIKKKKLSKCTVKNVTYTGKAVYPAVYDGSKKLKKGTDYTVSKISKNKNIGTANITIKFKGNYSGTVKKTFKIIPKNVSGIKLTKRTTSNISISWKKVSGVTGYKVYKYDYSKSKYVLYKTTNKTSCTVPGKSGETVWVKICSYKKVGNKNYLSSGKEYYNVTKPSKGKISKLTRPTFGQVNVYLPSDGYYQIQCSRNKKFDGYSQWKGYISDHKNNYVYFYNLASDKTYYFRVRKYVYNKNGDLLMGAWSDIKSIKTY